MTFTRVAIAATVMASVCHLMAAEKRVCSASCSTVGLLQSTPGKSCSDIYLFNKASKGISGNYWITTTTGVHQVYCDMLYY